SNMSILCRRRLLAPGKVTFALKRFTRHSAWHVNTQTQSQSKTCAMKTPLLIPLLSLSLCAAEFPAPYNSERGDAKPMPATEAAAKMRLPPGFKATLFAAEPDVQNPIAMAWHARGLQR